MKVEKHINDGFPFSFISYISDEISEHPAIIFHLHGAGERGDGDNDLELVLVNGFPKTIEDCPSFKDCILVMPQCPENSFWAAKVESLKKFMDSVCNLYNADMNRIYLAGLSMGGFGTWYTAMAYPDMFAAIAPCCGGGMPWNAEVLKMPVWAFHGSEDSVVLPSNSIDMINALKKTNDNVKFDLYEGVGHDSWVKAFDEPLLNWLLSQHK